MGDGRREPNLNNLWILFDTTSCGSGSLWKASRIAATSPVANRHGKRCVSCNTRRLVNACTMQAERRQVERKRCGLESLRREANLSQAEKLMSITHSTSSNKHELSSPDLLAMRSSSKHSTRNVSATCDTMLATVAYNIALVSSIPKPWM